MTEYNFLTPVLKASFQTFRSSLCEEARSADEAIYSPSIVSVANAGNLSL